MGSLSDRASRIADQDTCRQHEAAAQDHLKHRAEEWCFHVAVLDEGDGPELEEDQDRCDACRGPEILDQIGQGMAETAQCRHDTTGQDRKSTRLNSSHVKISYA